MKKPRLLILTKELIVLEEDLEHSLLFLLSEEISGVEVKGCTAAPYSPESLLKWAVLGKGTGQDNFLSNVQKGCELYVGIKTPKKYLLHEKTKDKRFDRYQIGERGFDLAKQNGIPAILLNHYSIDKIFDFIRNQTSSK